MGLSTKNNSRDKGFNVLTNSSLFEEVMQYGCGKCQADPKHVN